MSLLNDLINLDLSDSTEKIIAEYIWIGGSGMDLRSKGRTLPGPVSDPHKLPKWNYDGSSTGQAPGEDSEVILYPQAIFKDPFRRGNNILVMCDAYTPTGEPIPTNKRYNAAKIFSHPHVVAEVPWYGIEQEYTLLQKDVKWPIGWPVGGHPGPQLIKAYYYRYNQEEVSSYHAHGQYQNEVQLRDMGATAASNGSTNSDSLDQILARLSSMLEFDPSKPDYHLWNHGTVQPTVNNGNQDHDRGSVSRPTSPSSSERYLGPIVPPAGGQQRNSCPVVCDDFYCGSRVFKAIYSFFVGKVKAHVD